MFVDSIGYMVIWSEGAIEMYDMTSKTLGFIFYEEYQWNLGFVSKNLRRTPFMKTINPSFL